MTLRLSSRLFSVAPSLALVLLATLPSAAAAADNQIVVNRSHHYSLTPSTVLTLDRRPITPAQLVQLGNGFNTQVQVIDAVNGLAGGEAVAVELRSLLRGPVTSTAPLSVLNQVIGVNGDTVLAGLPRGGTAALAVGDLVQISGHLDSNGSIVASRVEGRLDPATDWKLSGLVSGLNGTHFGIGGQSVDFGGIVPAGCGPSLQNGQFVELESLRNPNYTPAARLVDVVELVCEDQGVDDPPGGSGLASIEGLVSLLPGSPTSPLSFRLAGLTVLTTARTSYRGGTVENVDDGVRLEAEGIYDAAKSTLQAREIRFTQAQVRFNAPLTKSDVSPGESLNILGAVVRFSPQTRDDDAIAARGLSRPRQVEVVGYVDGGGGVFATRVRDRGNPDRSRVVFSGPVTGVAAPVLQVLGQALDTRGALFRDAAGQLLTAEQFFAQVRAGSIVRANDCTYEAATGRITASEVELEDDGLVLGRGDAAAGGASRGTISAVVADRVFAAGFE